MERYVIRDGRTADADTKLGCRRGARRLSSTRKLWPPRSVGIFLPMREQSQSAGPSREIFITGGTGYIGQRLIPALVARRHRVRALARAQSRSRVPHGATVVIGDALVADTFVGALRLGDTLVHLIGTPHPSPSKADQFWSVDLASIHASVEASRRTGVAHLVYVSVAQPAPVMRAYVEARAAGEAAIVESGVPATILRPWYVVGPGHRWAAALAPLYFLAELLPPTREGARRLGLVTLVEMISALVSTVESQPPPGVRIIDVQEIRRLGRTASG